MAAGGGAVGDGDVAPGDEVAGLEEEAKVMRRPFGQPQLLEGSAGEIEGGESGQDWKPVAFRLPCGTGVGGAVRRRKIVIGFAR
ncbi:MAG: hypothetical protein IJT88_09195 [Kiritimatiellae bacterium]|nr:hypothetical protein [Kiritimatiellia bacterium]